MRIRHIKGAEEALEQNRLVIKEPAKYIGKWSREVFGNDAPLILEVGMGMGTFIREKSYLEPDKNFIGYEVNSTVLYKAITRYEKEEKGLDNLRFIRDNARFLSDQFAENEVDTIYLNFSDPWPKDKSANKRLTSPVFLKHYEKILKKDGSIEFKTDNRGLFDYSVETLPANGWEITEITYDLHNDEKMNEGNIMTEYEAKFSAKGNPIFKLIAKRK